MLTNQCPVPFASLRRARARPECSLRLMTITIRTMSPQSRTGPDTTFGKDELGSVFFYVASPRIASTCRHDFRMCRHSHRRRRKPRGWPPTRKRTNPTRRRGQVNRRGRGPGEGEEGRSGWVYTAGSPRGCPRARRSGCCPSGFRSLEVGVL